MILPKLYNTQLLKFVLVLFVCMPFIVKAQINKTEIEPYIQSYIKNKNNKGLIIGVIRQGKKQFYAYGETLKGNGILPDTNSIFELGGVSEVFTTSLLPILESSGQVSSLEPVGEILKDKVKVPYYQRIICEKPPINSALPDEVNKHRYICFPDPHDVPQMMVLCDLATHSAGLPEEPSAHLFTNKNYYSQYTLEKLNKYISSLPPNQAFGFEYKHSMVGMALLAEAFTQKTKKDFNTLLKEQILTPLSMNHTFINSDAAQNPLLLTGHTSKGSITPHKEYNVFTPAAGISSTASDMLHFIDAQLSVNASNLNTAIGETHIARIYANENTKQTMVGWGWLMMPISEKDKRQIVWQNSEKGGFSCYLGFIKDGETGIVILSNTANSVKDMGMNILKQLATLDKKSIK